MGTGVSPKRIATRNVIIQFSPPAIRFTYAPPEVSNLRILSWRYVLRICHQNYQKSFDLPQQINSNAIPYFFLFLRKEVIQPHLPIRLPCYDFTPVTRPAFGGFLFSVRSPTSGISDSHGVTGGVYKTRERIHRGILIRDY